MGDYNLKAIQAEAEIVVKEHKRATWLYERYHHPLESDGCMRVPAELIVELCQQQKSPTADAKSLENPHFMSSPKGFALHDYVSYEDGYDRTITGRKRTLKASFDACYGGKTTVDGVRSGSIRNICTRLKEGSSLTEIVPAGFFPDLLSNEDAKLIFNTFASSPTNSWNTEPDTHPDDMLGDGSPRFIQFLKDALCRGE